jgi:hypothetical protein
VKERERKCVGGVGWEKGTEKKRREERGEKEGRRRPVNRQKTGSISYKTGSTGFLSDCAVKARKKGIDCTDFLAD